MRNGRTKALTAASVTLEEFLTGLLDYRPGRLERGAIVHGHCHQKALVGMEPTRQVLSKVEGLEFSILDSGCCGMAGSFGYEQGHYRGEQGLRRARALSGRRGTAADDLVVAPGFSCRHQIADFCDGRRNLHTAELLAMAE